jgi:aspartyl-tRNA(Asn)/glutamyl-tRNA(Gln) amidotransferase subunit B
LHKIVTWIGICDGNMQEGSFRCDANVSVRKPGEALGTRREIKNLNSFKFMQQAIDYEVRWQIEQIEDGHAIQQATVLFNPDTGETRAMRTKEDAADYRYFPDPDLPPLVIADEWVQRVRSEMTELPRVMAQRFVSDFGLSEYDANALTQSRAVAAYFQSAAAICGQPKLAANWTLGEVSALMNRLDVNIDDVLIPIPTALGELLKRVANGGLTSSSVKVAFAEMCTRQVSAMDDLAAFIDQIIEDKDLKPMNDSGELEKIVDDVLAANPKNVGEYKAGNGKALNALVGQIMKGSKGKANPQQVNDLLRKKLG